MPRCALLAMLLLTPLTVAKDPPVTGEKVAGFEGIDKAVIEFMTTIDAQAATVAVSKDGKLLYSRGFGYADAAKKKPTPPDTLMRIASVSKPITAAVVKAAIRDKKLDADAKAFDLIGAKPPGKQKVADERVKDVTVAHLLAHKGGWDREKSSDPMFEAAKIERELGLKRAAKPDDVIAYMLTQPLQFDPGKKEVYSNFGYCVLGRVVEAAYKKPYTECVQEVVCKPHGIKDIKLGVAAAKKRDAREVWYPVSDDAYPLDVMDAHGGLIASAPALCQFLAAYWVDGNPRQKGQWGEYTFFGSLPGTTSMVRQRKDGWHAAVLFNSRRDKSLKEDNDVLKKGIDAALDGLPVPK
jgi:CubicO group peptidase (beta-lactamase class C family)